MNPAAIGLKIRRATEKDAVFLCRILNTIIAAGGTTALETAFTESELAEHFLSGPDCLLCLVAEIAGGEAHGFQTLVKNPELRQGWADIGTFTRREPLIRGVGTALFERMKSTARDLGIAAINASIRADNAGGIRYYESLGFRTYNVLKGVPLKNGTPVDRVSKVYNLA